MLMRVLGYPKIPPTIQGPGWTVIRAAALIASGRPIIAFLGFGRAFILCFLHAGSAWPGGALGR
jgi:hypothetical protein